VALWSVRVSSMRIVFLVLCATGSASAFEVQKTNTGIASGTQRPMNHIHYDALY
jgi:hypothetical protein